MIRRWRRPAARRVRAVQLPDAQRGVLEDLVQLRTLGELRGRGAVAGPAAVQQVGGAQLPHHRGGVAHVAGAVDRAHLLRALVRVEAQVGDVRRVGDQPQPAGGIGRGVQPPIGHEDRPVRRVGGDPVRRLDLVPVQHLLAVERGPARDQQRRGTRQQQHRRDGRPRPAADEPRRQQGDRDPHRLEVLVHVEGDVADLHQVRDGEQRDRPRRPGRHGPSGRARRERQMASTNGTPRLVT